MTATLELEMSSPFAFEPPGPGAWTVDADHQSAARGVLMQDLFTRNFVAGTRSCFSRYGMPLDRLDGCHVNGWFYVRPVPAGVPDNGKQPPPAPILKVATRLIPELRRRRKVAAETVASRRWLADARAWASERPEWMSRCNALLAIELDSLDDAALADHVHAALTLAEDMIRRHFSLLGPTVGVGRLLVAARAWGFTPDEVIPVLRGGSPASTESRLPLSELAELASGRPRPRTVEELRALSPRAAELVDFYLRRFGPLPLADDVEATTLAEHPDQLVELVRAQGATVVEQSTQEPLADLLARVPAEDRARLERLVAEARECYASLDDNSGVTALTIGVVRRAGLEAARRGVRRGVLAVERDVFNLTPSELVVLAGGGTPIGTDAFTSRRELRAAVDRQSPPPVLGGPVVAPPDPGVFPGPLAELAAAVGAYLELKFTASPHRPGPDPSGSLQVDGVPPVTGIPVVNGTASGRIVVCRDASDAITRIEPGDILVCPYTAAAHNAIFPMLAGVVTQFGGPLGHTAVLAREFGIPAVVGARSLPLHLDGLHGTLIAPPAS